MPFTLRVFFSGLCAFIPDQPFSSNSANLGAVEVVLPDLLKPLSVPPRTAGGSPAVLDQHYPILELNTRQLQSGSRQPDFMSNLPAFKNKGYCLLLEESLTIRLDDLEPVALGVTAPAFNASFGNSLFFVAAMERISPGSRLKTDLTPKRDPDKPGVIASMRLQQGQLSTAAKSSDLQVVQDPANPTGPPRFQQQISTQLLLEIPNVQTKVVLRSSLPGATDIVLAPIADRPLENFVEIHLQNVEVDDFIGIPPTPPYLSASAVLDFASYYETLIQPASPGASPLFQPVPLPQRLAHEPFATPRGGSCPPLTASRPPLG